jgi:hypothetical protein
MCLIVIGGKCACRRVFACLWFLSLLRFLFARVVRPRVLHDLDDSCVAEGEEWRICRTVRAGQERFPPCWRSGSPGQPLREFTYLVLRLSPSPHVCMVGPTYTGHLPCVCPIPEMGIK